MLRCQEFILNTCDNGVSQPSGSGVIFDPIWRCSNCDIWCLEEGWRDISHSHIIVLCTMVMFILCIPLCTTHCSFIIYGPAILFHFHFYLCSVTISSSQLTSCSDITDHTDTDIVLGESWNTPDTITRDMKTRIWVMWALVGWYNVQICPHLLLAVSRRVRWR